MLNLLHDVALMQVVSRWMTRVAVLMLLVAGGGWLLQRPYFAIHQFRFVGDVQQLSAKQLHDLVEKNLSSGLAGGFFSMELRDVQSSLDEITWIKNASIRRVWPHEIEVNVEAYQPIAQWGGRYLSAEGQLFDSALSSEAQSRLLRATGPDAAAELVAKQIPILMGWFRPLGTLQSVTLSERYSWRVKLSNGLEVELGREDTPTALEERVTRLVSSSSFIKDNMGESGYVDLRYPNGFAMRSDRLHRTAAATSMNKTGEQHD
ncbi:MAG: cell division protein FtsQ/DivIB [Formosimonas sp.]